MWSSRVENLIDKYMTGGTGTDRGSVPSTSTNPASWRGTSNSQVARGRGIIHLQQIVVFEVSKVSRPIASELCYIQSSCYVTSNYFVSPPPSKSNLQPPTADLQSPTSKLQPPLSHLQASTNLLKYVKSSKTASHRSGPTPDCPFFYPQSRLTQPSTLSPLLPDPHPSRTSQIAGLTAKITAVSPCSRSHP